MRVMGVTFVMIIALVLIASMFLILRIIEKPQEEKKNLTVSEAIQEALKLYQEKKAEGMQFNSQCLGSCGNYAVDIVHVPRNDEDNQEENKCQDYRAGIVSKFIELDKEGNIVRVI